MSDKLMTIKEAATFLAVTERTVRKYVKQGFLTYRKVHGDRRYWLSPEEVGQLREDREESHHRTIVTKKDFLRVRAELHRLRSQMDVVLRILDAKEDPLRMSPSYANDLLEVCVEQSRATNWQLPEMQSWVEIFLRADEEDFKAIADSTEERKPWRPFLKLCVAMTAYVGTHKNYETSLELQSIHRQLAEGRRRLRVSALIYAEMYGGMDPDIQRYVLGDSPATMADTLSRVLKRK